MDGGDWISLAGVVIAGGSAVWAVVSARRAGRAQERAEHYQARAEQQAERATRAAEKAAAAETQSAAAAKRAADALERQNRIAEEQADAAEGVPWRLAHHRGDIYELRNETDTPKYHVEMTGPKIPRAVEAERVDGRSSLQFMAIPAGGMGDQIDVTWHRRQDKSDTPRKWSGIKPPKPKTETAVIRPRRK